MSLLEESDEEEKPSKQFREEDEENDGKQEQISVSDQWFQCLLLLRFQSSLSVYLVAIIWVYLLAFRVIQLLWITKENDLK